MDKLTQKYSLEAGNYMSHPSVKNFIASRVISPALLRDIWNTPHELRLFSKNEVVINAAEDPRRLMVVTSGWLFSYSKLPNGQRQVHRIYRDGDIIGDEDFSRSSNSFNVASATSSRVSILDVSAFRQLLRKHNPLLDYFSTHISQNLLLAMDHAKSISRLQTKERLAHFLLSMLSRIRWTSGESRLMDVRIPLNQSIISDYLGLTNVHVSRTLKTLQTEKLIARPEPNLYRIVDEESLIKMSGFIDRQKQFETEYTVLETSPKPQTSGS